MFKITTVPITDQLIQQLIPILTKACEILREEYQQYCSGADFNVEKKPDHSPVTQADYRVNQYITEQLRRISDFPLLSEEGSPEHRKSWQKFWLLDPLDGTKEFLHQRPEFTINLSIVNESKTVFAILAIPCEDILYIAPEHGLPLKFDIRNNQWYEFFEQDFSHENNIKIGLSQSSQKKPKYEDYLTSLATLCSVSVFKAGSAYKFCMMLEGEIDIYPRFHPTCEWDTSAGQCLLERVGGGLTDFKGCPFLYNQRDTLLNGGFIAYRHGSLKKVAFEALELMSKKG